MLTALLTVTGLYAISISEYADPSSWIPESLYIGMGNDKWALANISYNMDDQLSFSEHFYVEAPAYWLDVNMLAITNRGWQNGWSTLDFSAEGDGNKIDGRYDVTQIFFSLPLDLLVTDNFYIWIRPEAGVSIIGDQNYAFLQNTLHKLINAAPLEVDYETPGKNMAKLSLNMSAEVGGILLRLGDSLLSISARADFMNTIGFGYKQMEGMEIMMPMISISVDYRSPVKFDDTVVVDTKLISYDGNQIEVAYRIFDKKTGEDHAVARSKHFFMNKSGIPISLKRIYPELDTKFFEMK